MRNTLLSCLFLFCGVCAFAQTDNLVVMSYNARNASSKDGTNSWEYRYPATAMMLDDQKPDVVGIQELEFSQFDYLETVFEKTFKFVGVGGKDGKQGGEYSAIAYNPKTIAIGKWGTVWLSDTPGSPSPVWGTKNFRTITWAVLKNKKNGKQFIFCTTQFDENKEAVLKASELLVKKIAEINKDNLPVVITGDFCVDYGDSGLSPVKSAFKSSRKTAVVSDDVCSYHGWGKVKFNYDHIWYSGISCTLFETVTKSYYDRTFISDHYPIKAQFVF